MAIIQYTGTLSYVNENGDVLEMYPNVKTDANLTETGKAADAAAVRSAIDSAIDSVKIELNETVAEKTKTDTTLSKDGIAADAAAVGTKFESVETNISELTDSTNTFKTNMESIIQALTAFGIIQTVSVVDELPAEPDETTLYFVKK